MSRILIFSGTTEGRRLAELLSANRIECEISVATEYGEYVMPKLDHVTVHTGRMETGEMTEFIRNGAFDAVVDATHPFAAVVSEHIRESLAGTEIPYLRLKRSTTVLQKEENAKALEQKTLNLRTSTQAGKTEKSGENNGQDRYYFDTAAACAKALERCGGNILLTTGSKDLAAYCENEELKKRLYVRVLPGQESIAICEANRIWGKQIIAMQGPFGTELNRALIRQFKIRALVTKESGAAGGYGEKLAAADEERIPVYVIGNPEKEKPGDSFSEVCGRISEITGKRIRNQLALVGVGMGTRDFLTVAADREIRRADYIFGAPRLLETLETLETDAVLKPYYLARDILPCLDRLTGRGVNIVVLFSGDTGFYSGCHKLYENVKNREDCNTVIFPGISAISGMAAATGVPWQDARILSIHGHGEDVLWKGQLLDAVRHTARTWLLVSGAGDVRLLGEMLSEAALDFCQVMTGFQLSYPEQEIQTLTPAECAKVEREGLYICLILNPQAEKRLVCHGMKDVCFVRDKVPMTKEEIREISICRLGLLEDSVVYDIGSGTGSIAVEIAVKSPGIQVYAIEKKPRALELIRENKRKFAAFNIEVTEGEAPEALEPLPAATHAFIGGSGGKLEKILDALYLKNPQMKVVLNAVSLETVQKMAELKKDRRICNLEIIQVQVNRAKEIGSYQLMQAENPVCICSFQFQKEV
ncbi:bifunctional cobalt-precorrin-7 (C(5))-methyltransferase/cobalt-precorrin-6B (C(15))-methyltransferase [Hespellia stercorisuis]|uniref:Precorrin-6Y C5,15-methyltransferase (Decarboxylating) n=1 Tax=Hespellia stercorisuis DSM 15480 TaxID=1121950 RepID=A0A1M6KJH0_9FIRM|nr:bifunctional cobalt-precorrin-7 (C(5))-methyltransferase/cobalt-precorrin-6B (C(15))-methyltransferase [Hespellia stercorisuis]SHJ59097.1 precorrin-6Y C5,15-methyltransferase (decarboxylating) [Hespellia stercorisuis DSM 15480]